MTGPVEFLLISDLHQGAADDAGLRTDTAANLRATLDAVAAIRPRPAFALFAGDLANHGLPESYRHLRSELARLDVPALYALGNHDARGAFRAHFLGEVGGSDAACFHEAVVSGVHVVTLDSSVPGRISGALDDAQFAFLDEALDRHPELPKIVMIHHPPALDPDAEGFEILAHADADRLAETIAGRGVAGIVSGHIHRDRVAMWRGVPLVTCIGLHCEIVEDEGSDALRHIRGASFARCTLRDGGLEVRFVQLPSDRADLGQTPLSRLREMEAA
jgi:3',5'-cyclic-AMP phosphodiesterase